MTQEEALKCLKKHKRWMITKEVAEKTTMEKRNAAKNLAALYKYGEVERKQVRVENHYTYKWRIKWANNQFVDS